MLLPSSSSCLCFLKIPRRENHIIRSSSCVFLPIFWPTISELTHRDQLAALFTLFRPFRPFFEIPRCTVRFWDSTNYHAQSPTKTIYSEVFFWVCFGFLRFSFAITVLSCFVPQARVFISLLRFRSFSPFFYLLRFRLFLSDFLFYDFVYFHQIFSFIFFLSFHNSDFVFLLYQITYIVSEYVYF